MSAETASSKPNGQEKLLANKVANKVEEYTGQFSHFWPEFPEAHAVMRIGYYLDMLIFTHSDGNGDLRFNELCRLDPVFDEFERTFPKDVALVIGGAFPASDSADKLRLAEAGKIGLCEWVNQRRTEDSPQ